MITVEHLTKCYGDFKAVNDLSFEIEDGHVYGFLGPNGAGKSTTMNIMTGCLSATSGQVKIDGLDIFEEATEAKRLIGYLPEQPPLYMNETPLEYLTFVGHAKGLKEPELSRQIHDVLSRTRIEDVQNRKISALSKGYKQRVGIAQALLGDPHVIILDEPTVGLDPIQIIEIRDLIRELGLEHTVILSSHILSEVQTICDKILIIAHGELIAFDSPDQLEKRMLGRSEITLLADAPLERVRPILSAQPYLTECSLTTQDTVLTAATVCTNLENLHDAARRLFFTFAEEGIAILELQTKRTNLEEIFIELTENSQENQCENADSTDSPAPDSVGDVAVGEVSDQ